MLIRLSLILVFVCLFLTSGANGDRILFLVEKLSVKNTHSNFIKSLEDRGHSITLKLFDDSSLGLIKYEEFSYDHLVIFSPSADEFGGTINVAEIMKFVDGGGNVLLAAGPNPGEAIRKVATEFGFEFDADKTKVIDHHNFDAKLDDNSHTTLSIQPETINYEIITGEKSKMNPVIYRGVALTAESQNPLRLTLMTASASAYSFDPNSPINEYPAAVGKSTILIGALQARNNARIIISGSTDFFSDEFLNADVKNAARSLSKSGNSYVIGSMSKWVFKEAGVLRVNSVKHHIVGQQSPPDEYTIMEECQYSITIDELKDKKWIPFTATDVQLEFVRIDPFIRTTLRNANGRLSAKFKIPDVYGVFKFLVDYHRLGYTHLIDVQQVSVRPLKHTQYERFSHCAFPYYVSAFSMMIGVVIFAFVFLYHKDSK